MGRLRKVSHQDVPLVSSLESADSVGEAFVPNDFAEDDSYPISPVVTYFCPEQASHFIFSIKLKRVAKARIFCLLLVEYFHYFHHVRVCDVFVYCCCIVTHMFLCVGKMSHSSSQVS